MINKKLLIPMAAIAIAGVYGATQVSAANDAASNPRASLIQKLADTFHVDKAKVQAVFDEHRGDMRDEREAKYEDYLAQAVKDGKLTETQKTVVLAEHNKILAKIDTVKAGNAGDPKAAKQAIEDEIEAWTKSSGIDRKWLMIGDKRHGHGGPGMPAKVFDDHGGAEKDLPKS